MTAVRARDQVVVAEVGAYSDGHRFGTDVRVHESGHVALAELPADPLLEQADPQHLAEHRDEQFIVARTSGSRRARSSSASVAVDQPNSPMRLPTGALYPAAAVRTRIPSSSASISVDTFSVSITNNGSPTSTVDPSATSHSTSSTSSS